MQDQIIAVIADTHIPDRVRNLHPGLLPAIKSLCVNQILHAGDICRISVLETLQSVAPLIAVRGNRDLFIREELPSVAEIEINGVRLGLSHGYGSLWDYFLEKLRSIFQRYRLDHYMPLLKKTFPLAKVIIFGHTHVPENVWVGGRLFFNPGSVGIGGKGQNPSFGLLRVNTTGEIKSDIIYLGNAGIVRGRWVVK